MLLLPDSHPCYMHACACFAGHVSFPGTEWMRLTRYRLQLQDHDGRNSEEIN